jgi:UDP-N-acetylglucosamine diphosphorylase/glucosamine-1-phosphate N-acetyltransferase
MNIILADVHRDNLLPFTFMRPVAGIRCGILTIAGKWNFLAGGNCSFLTEDYLKKKYPIHVEEQNIIVNGAVLITPAVFDEVKKLQPGNALHSGDTIIAVCVTKVKMQDVSTFEHVHFEKKIASAHTIRELNYPWDIFNYNDEAIRSDFEMLTQNRSTQNLSSTNILINPSQIFIEEGAKVECAVLNASTGPIYIGKDAEVMEGCTIRGPFALGEHAVLKMAAKIYGATTIGPQSKVGGEVSNAVIFGFSNKAHDGFLGNSVIAEWCNLGADTNNSNLKNNYGKVKAWNYKSKKMIDTGLQFCGLMMADHSKAAINTMFNTGTVVGVSANVFGGGFPPKFIPSFSWGGFSDEAFQLDKAVALAEEVYKRRNLLFDQTELEIMSHVNTLELRLPSN